MDKEKINEVLEKSMSEEHVTIINKLSEPKRDEEIASELNFKETTVRTILNDLHAEGLVEYERSKNKETGWYTYTWQKRDNKIQEYVQSHLHQKLDRLETQLDQEQNGTMLACSCDRVPLNQAMEMDFICPECNEAFSTEENSMNLDEIRSQIDRINNLLNQGVGQTPQQSM